MFEFSIGIIMYLRPQDMLHMLEWS